VIDLLVAIALLSCVALSIYAYCIRRRTRRP
jgi:hypothetical protein